VAFLLQSFKLFSSIFNFFRFYFQLFFYFLVVFLFHFFNYFFVLVFANKFVIYSLLAIFVFVNKDLTAQN